MYYRKIATRDCIEFRVQLDEPDFDEKIALIYGASCKGMLEHGAVLSVSAEVNASDKRYVSGSIRTRGYESVTAIVDWLSRMVENGEVTSSGFGVIPSIDSDLSMGGELVRYLYHKGTKPNWLS